MTAREWFRALGMVLGFVFAATAVEAWAPMNGLTYLTFNRPVALPGVTLGAGTYAFEIVNPMDGSDVVMVRDRARKQVLYSGLTNGVDRDLSASRDGAVVFGESKAEAPLPILAWFPPSTSHGRQFIYRR